MRLMSIYRKEPTGDVRPRASYKISCACKKLPFGRISHFHNERWQYSRERGACQRDFWMKRRIAPDLYLLPFINWVPPSRNYCIALGKRRYGKVCSNHVNGLTCTPSTHISQCRWGPVTCPVAPISPMVCPASTCSSTET